MANKKQGSSGCTWRSWWQDHQQQTMLSSQTTIILELILYISFTTATVLIMVPHEYTNGTPIPIIPFKGLPSTFCAFIISIILAFSGAFSALMIPDKPNISRLSGYCSMLSMASATALLILAIYRSTTTTS